MVSGTQLRGEGEEFVDVAEKGLSRLVVRCRGQGQAFVTHYLFE
jgi:hypothetical protein